MQRLWEGLQLRFQPPKTSEDAHRREAVRVQGMWENLCLQLVSHSPSEASPPEEALSEGSCAVLVPMGAVPPAAPARCRGLREHSTPVPGRPRRRLENQASGGSGCLSVLKTWTDTPRQRGRGLWPQRRWGHEQPSGTLEMAACEWPSTFHGGLCPWRPLWLQPSQLP